MTKDKLTEALKIAHPTRDSRGRSKYGMGMKTAAFWIGSHWQIVTCEWGSGEEWTADIDLKQIDENRSGSSLPITLSMSNVSKDAHYTKIIIKELNRYFQKRTEDTIKSYLGSMYQFDINENKMKLLFGDEEIKTADAYDLDTDPAGNQMRTPVDVKIRDKQITGWVGVLRQGSGGRKFGGFSLFQNKRQIQGFPNAWKPRAIFSGVDDEGANNLVAQRLTGQLYMDDFQVSHTKDAILFEADEEEQLEKYLAELTRDYKDYAIRRRGPTSKAWSREKVRDLAQSLAKEFSSSELSDAVTQAILPPLDAIIAASDKQVANLKPEDEIASYSVADFTVKVSLEDKSEWEPYVNINASATPGAIHVIINRLHPYYDSLESQDAVLECVRQYIYDAIAEYRVSKQVAQVRPDNVRRLKDSILRAKDVELSNAANALQEGEYQAIIKT